MNTTRRLAAVAFATVTLGTLAPSPQPAQAQSPPTGTTAGITAPAPYAAVLAALPQATAVHIRDGWMGLSRIAPIEHQYDFERIGTAFRARTRCGARGQTHAAADATLPVATVTTSLARLATISVRAGNYVPTITHTDDYPSASITVETPAGALTLSTRSQGRFAPPWEITHPSGPHGIVSSSAPGEAIAALITAASGSACNDWIRGLESH